MYHHKHKRCLYILYILVLVNVNKKNLHMYQTEASAIRPLQVLTDTLKKLLK